MSKKPFSRRSFVKFAGLASAGVASAVGAPAASKTVKENKSDPVKDKIALSPLPAQYREYTYFTPEEARFIEAAVDRLIPSDDVGSGALELGVAYYIDRQMESIYGDGAKMYLSGSFKPGEATQGYQLPLRPREIYPLGIASVDDYCRANYQGKSFAELSESDRFLTCLLTCAIAFRNYVFLATKNIINTNYKYTTKKMNPINYKTQSGLIKALTRNSEKPMSVKLAWWFHNAEYALVENFGWTEKDAAKFVAAYHPTTSIYKATV